MKTLLERLDEQLSRCSDPPARAELLAERACYLARIGRIAEANEIAAALRRDFPDGRNARVAVWVMLIEGLVLYFGSLDIRSRDRLLRALLVSEACDIEDLRLLNAAWLAHIEFNRSDFTSMIHALKKCANGPVALPSSWQIRFSLVLADSFMYSRQIQIARRWYERARLGAVWIGDEATLGAVIYNRAALSLVNLRIDALSNQVDSEALRYLSLEIDSADAYQQVARHDSLAQLVSVCRARVLMMQQEYLSATAVFKSLLECHDLSMNLGSDRMLLLAELAECLYRSGSRDEAETILLEIQPHQCIDMTVDDQYIFVSLYVGLAREMGLSSLVDGYSSLLESSRTACTKSVADLQISLEGFRELICD